MDFILKRCLLVVFIEHERFRICYDLLNESNLVAKVCLKKNFQHFGMEISATFFEISSYRRLRGKRLQLSVARKKVTTRLGA